MVTESAHRPISKGICTFCKSELAKNKMTQHLKFCKQRLAAIASQEEKSRKPKTRLFHVLAEGQYSPQYWLHFEIPATKTLWSLDGFIKDMWIDDLDHLSGFEINGTHYRDNYSDDFFSFAVVEEREEEEISEEEISEEEISEEEKEQEIGKIIEEIISTQMESTSLYKEDLSSVANPLPVEWIAEVKKPRSDDELINFLKEELVRIVKENRQVRKLDQGLSPQEQYKRERALSLQKWIVEDILEAVEDRSMDVALGRVLKVGQKFSYVYDFGSSTYINLRVIAEREGIVEDEKKPVRLLAQNTAPIFPCSVCGKPGTKVAMSYYYGGGIDDSVYCDACAEKREEDEFNTLPIINSPRVGVL